MKRFHSTGTETMTTARFGGVCLMGAIAGLLPAYLRLIHFRFSDGLLGQIGGQIGERDLLNLAFLADRRTSGYGRYRQSEQCSFLSVLRLG